MFGRFSLFKKQGSGKPVTEAQEKFKYCPSCGDEYRADISRCGVCDAELVFRDGSTGRDLSANGGDVKQIVRITADDEMTTIKKGGLADVKTLQRVLSDEGIDSLIAGDGPDCTRGCCNSAAFDLNVRTADFSAARSVLEQEFQRTTGLADHDYSGSAEAVFDERSGSVSCPACSFVFVPGETVVCPECGLCF